MHILIISYFYPPDAAIGGRRAARLADGLRANGHTVEVVAFGDRNSISGESADGEVFRTPASTSVLPWVIQRVLPYNERIPWVPGSHNLGSSRIRQKRPDVLISTVPPLACHIAAFWLARRHQLPWIADFRDPLSDDPFRNRKSGWVLDRLTEKWIVRNADVIVMNTQAAVHALSARHTDQPPGKFRLIWNGFDPRDAVGPRPLATPGIVTLLHAGSIYGHRHPEPVIESLDRLICSGKLDPSSVQLRCIGQWAEVSLLRKSQAMQHLVELGVLKIDNATLPPSEARLLMETSSHLLLLDQNERRNGVQVPGKLFEYLQTGRPLLCVTHPGSMSQFILERSGVPFIILDPDSSPERMDREMLTFLALESTPVRPSQWFHDTFNISTQTGQWLDAIRFAKDTAQQFRRKESTHRSA